jgi:uncharacterized protein with HEPN domain
MSNKDKDLARLKHILEAILLIEEFTKDAGEEVFFNNSMMQSAVVRQFELIGEASRHISSELQNAFIEIEWRLMADFRNLLINEFFTVDESEIWATVRNNIPGLKEQIEVVIYELEK